MSLSSHQRNGGHDEWLTPPEILKALGPFDLDPCAPVNPPWRTAAQMLHRGHDGLSQDWAPRVLLAIADDGTITPWPQNCHHQHTSNALDAGKLSLSPWSISVPVIADRSAFFHAAGSVWRRSMPSGSENSESSGRASVGSTRKAVSSDAQNADASSLQHSNSSGQSRNAVTDLCHGAESALGSEHEAIERSSDFLPQGSKLSRSSARGTRNPVWERKPSRQAQESITPSAGREEPTFRLSGDIPTGWTVSPPSDTPAHTAARLATCTRTTSSRYPVLNVPELLSATWRLPASHATYQKEPSIRTPGLKAKLLSLGLLTSCGCFVGTYKPRIWLNPPFGRESAKWMARLATHGNGIALLAARTETAMFFDHVWGDADAVLFLKGRPHFYYVDGVRAKANSGAPICLIAYGADNADCLASCGLAGAFVRLRTAEGLAA